MVESNFSLRAVHAAYFALCCTLAGCASPGPPLPPTLNLPGTPAPNSVGAERVGSTVIVRWTTPERTTDQLLIRGAVHGEICRTLVTAPDVEASTHHAGATEGRAAKSSGSSSPCLPVVAEAVAHPGVADEAIDTLPANLTSGPPQLLAYRVQLKNAAGRTAGASVAVYAVAGDAPPALEDFRAHAAKAGVVLEWTRAENAHADATELQRTTIGPAPGEEKRQPGSISGALSRPKEPAEVRLRAGEVSSADPGGTIDTGAEVGHTYRYVASRVRTIGVGGQQLQVRSAPSAAVTVRVEDVFAPGVPQGLVAVPGSAGDGATTRPVIDLSWEPNDEPRVAGYRVYRRRVTGGSAGQWLMISGAQPLTAAAYRDAGVPSGERYAYRVTAVGVNGLESLPSREAEETASAP